MKESRARELIDNLAYTMGNGSKSYPLGTALPGELIFNMVELHTSHPALAKIIEDNVDAWKIPPSTLMEFTGNQAVTQQFLDGLLMVYNQCSQEDVKGHFSRVVFYNGEVESDKAIVEQALTTLMKFSGVTKDNVKASDLPLSYLRHPQADIGFLESIKNREPESGATKFLNAALAVRKEQPNLVKSESLTADFLMAVMKKSNLDESCLSFICQERGDDSYPNWTLEQLKEIVQNSMSNPGILRWVVGQSASNNIGLLRDVLALTTGKNNITDDQKADILAAITPYRSEATENKDMLLSILNSAPKNNLHVIQSVITGCESRPEFLMHILDPKNRKAEFNLDALTAIAQACSHGGKEYNKEDYAPVLAEVLKQAEKHETNPLYEVLTHFVRETRGGEQALKEYANRKLEANINNNNNHS